MAATGIKTLTRLFRSFLEEHETLLSRQIERLNEFESTLRTEHQAIPVSSSLVIEAPKMQVNATSAASSKSSVLEEKKKDAKKVKKVIDPNKPKKPMTGYLLFCNAERNNLRSEMQRNRVEGEVTNKELMTALGNKWSAMSAEQKKSYLSEAEGILTTYKSKMEQYNSKQSASAAAALAEDEEEEPEEDEEARVIMQRHEEAPLVDDGEKKKKKKKKRESEAVDVKTEGGDDSDHKKKKKKKSKHVEEEDDE